MGLLNKFRPENKRKSYEEEVITNLISILNTKRGYGAIQNDLGMESYFSMKSSTSSIKKLISDIKKNISTYEKRVQVLDIIPVSSGSLMHMKFQIACKIGGSFHSFYIGFTNFPKPVTLEEEV